MKRIYLDQNKWIDLRNVLLGQGNDKRFVTTLDAARKAVTNGSAIFPLSRTHIIETARTSDNKQRELMARLMTELSQGEVLRTTQWLVEASIQNEVRRMFCSKEPVEEFSPFGRGFDEAFGFNWADRFPDRVPEYVELFRQHVDAPDKWIDVLSSNDEAVRLAGINSTDRVATDWVEWFAKDRETLMSDTPDLVRRVLCAKATVYFKPAILRSLDEIGRSWDEFGAVGKDRLVSFWNSIPCFKSQSEFEFALLRDSKYKLTPNDLRDLGFLGPAIPYCDVVISERHSMSIARRANLDKDFNTVLLTDLSELRTLLG